MRFKKQFACEVKGIIEAKSIKPTVEVEEVVNDLTDFLNVTGCLAEKSSATLYLRSLISKYNTLLGRR